MKERPVIFKAEMVKAILDGSKTQTRRIIKTFDFMGDDCIHVRDHNNKKIAPLSCQTMKEQTDVANNFCPHGKAGEKLWVRENFKVINFYEGFDDGGDHFAVATATIEYQDGTTKDVELSCNVPLPDGREIDEIVQAERAFKKKIVPSIHMPRWASRIELEIIDIRAERLNDIADKDAIAEGIYCELTDGRFNCVGDKYVMPYKPKFVGLWESINGKGSWSENPWVWIVEFKKVKDND